jgi:hypothetical protein
MMATRTAPANPSRNRKHRLVDAGHIARDLLVPRTFRNQLTRRQVGEIKNLVGGNLFSNPFGLARVADGVGSNSL